MDWLGIRKRPDTAFASAPGHFAIRQSLQFFHCERTRLRRFPLVACFIRGAALPVVVEWLAWRVRLRTRRRCCYCICILARSDLSRGHERRSFSAHRTQHPICFSQLADRSLALVAPLWFRGPGRAVALCISV